jgi:hypothetical protein
MLEAKPGLALGDFCDILVQAGHACPAQQSSGPSDDAVHVGYVSTQTVSNGCVTHALCVHRASKPESKQ